MISEYLSRVNGIFILPVISLIFCFIFFAVTIIWVFRLDKKYISRMGNLPLDQNSENIINSEMKNEVIK